jgi:hypothetical protein
MKKCFRQIGRGLGTLLMLSFAMLMHGPVEAGSHGPCLSGLRSVLVAGGFSGSVDCRHDRFSMRRIGYLKSSGHRFAIYYYQYSLKPICPECAVHGGQRIIILRDGSYLGQYKPDWQVSGQIFKGHLVLIPRCEPGMTEEDCKADQVSFTPEGPPPRVHIFDDYYEFFR